MSNIRLSYVCGSGGRIYLQYTKGADFPVEVVVCDDISNTDYVHGRLNVLAGPGACPDHL